LVQFNPNILSLAVLFIIVLGVCAVMLMAARLIGPKRMNSTKAQAFECGMDPIGSAREGGLRTRFYLVAISFIVFDIEAIFLYPWAVSFKTLGLGPLVAVLIFVLALFAGLFYEIRKGVFNWK
jgi:NADH-quinone oxidoreductase subunit A